MHIRLFSLITCVFPNQLLSKFAKEIWDIDEQRERHGWKDFSSWVKENIEKVANETTGVVESIGKTIDDGLNKLDEKISSMDKVNLNVEVPKDKNIINNVIALFVTFIMFNVKWIKYKIEFFGYESSTSITVLHSDMFDLSFMFGLAKICAIFAILLFFVNIVNTFIKLDEHIPSLKKYKLAANFLFSYILII